MPKASPDMFSRRRHCGATFVILDETRSSAGSALLQPSPTSVPGDPHKQRTGSNSFWVISVGHATETTCGRLVAETSSCIWPYCAIVGLPTALSLTAPRLYSAFFARLVSKGFCHVAIYPVIRRNPSMRAAKLKLPNSSELTILTWL
jgi:hypothetical protein